MLLCVFVQVFPQLRSQDVLVVHLLVQNVAKGWTLLRIHLLNVSQGEPFVNIEITPETDQDYPFAMLRNEMPCINDLGVLPLWCINVCNVVAQLVQGLTDHSEGFSFVVTLEVFDVLQQERCWFLDRQNTGNIKEQGSLCITLKTVLPAKGVFLRYTGQGERLTRETRQQHLMVRNLLIDVLVGRFFVDIQVRTEGDLPDILIKSVLQGITEVVCLVGANGILVPLRGEYTFATNSLKTLPDPTDPREQIDESERRLEVVGFRSWQH